MGASALSADVRGGLREGQDARAVRRELLREPDRRRVHLEKHGERVNKTLFDAI